MRFIYSPEGVFRWLQLMGPPGFAIQLPDVKETHTEEVGELPAICIGSVNQDLVLLSTSGTYGWHSRGPTLGKDCPDGNIRRSVSTHSSRGSGRS